MCGWRCRFKGRKCASAPGLRPIKSKCTRSWRLRILIRASLHLLSQMTHCSWDQFPKTLKINRKMAAIFPATYQVSPPLWLPQNYCDSFAPIPRQVGPVPSTLVWLLFPAAAMGSWRPWNQGTRRHLGRGVCLAFFQDSICCLGTTSTRGLSHSLHPPPTQDVSLLLLPTIQPCGQLF